MFGRLRLSTCALSPEQKDSYKADFCSLCHSLKSQTGYLSTLLTNYDSTLWLAVANGLSLTPVETEHRSCTALPFRKVLVSLHSEEIQRSNTALLWMLIQAKAKDDADDEGTWKAKAALRLSAENAREAEQYLAARGFQTDVLSQLPERQKQAESHPQATFSQVCAPTQAMMSEAFAHLATVCQRLELKNRLQDFGTSLGTCIYLLDALDDHVADLKAGQFNPLFRCSDALTRTAIAELAGHWLEHLESSLDLLALSASGHEIVGGVVKRLRQKMTSHPLLEGAAVITRRNSAPRRAQEAAFCAPHLAAGDEEKEKAKECCLDCGDGCECCCEAPDCCESCGGCDCCSTPDCCSPDCCSSCDCGGCDCGGCSCSVDSLRRFLPRSWRN